MSRHHAELGGRPGNCAMALEPFRSSEAILDCAHRRRVRGFVKGAPFGRAAAEGLGTLSATSFAHIHVRDDLIRCSYAVYPRQR